MTQPLPAARLVRALLLAVLLLATAVAGQAQTDDESAIPPPRTVTIAGTLQPQLGCPGQWNTTCQDSMLIYSEQDDLWLATFELSAGNYEYKAALNGSWDDNYGLNAEYYGPNIPLQVAEDGPITFWYDHKTRWVSDNVNSIMATVIGDFQEEIGCAADGQVDCLRSLLQDPRGSGTYTYVTAAIPPGDYEAWVIFDAGDDVMYGAEGEADGPAVAFSVPENVAVIFTFDPATNVLEITTGDPSLAATAAPAEGLPAPAVPMPDLVVIPGTIQSVLGCPGDWQPDCAETALLFDEDNQLWTAGFDIPAGDYEYKVALNGSWAVNFGQDAERDGPNIPLALDADTTVTFYFDHNTGWVADDVNNIIANVPGDFQSEIGCPQDWMPACLRSWLQDPDGDGVYTFQTVSIPAGSYEAKVAVNQSWAENYGEGGARDGANIGFTVPADGTLVTFTWDSRSKLINIGVGAGAAAPGNIREQRAFWVAADTIAWNVDPGPGYRYEFHYSRGGNPFSLGPTGIRGSDVVVLTHDENGLSPEIAAIFPHLRNHAAFKFGPEDAGTARIALKGQIAVTAVDGSGELVDATGLQIPGVLDDLYAYDGPLGVTWENGVPTLRVWAPTARLVRLHLFDDTDPTSRASVHSMRVDPRTGVWSVTGDADWNRKYYLYEVQVFVPSEGTAVTNLVTDPYSLSLSMNSRRSQIVDLSDTDLMPAGWPELAKPPLARHEDMVIYEIHVRDFSVNDPSVPDEFKGTFKAFTLNGSHGIRHLSRLAEVGLTHLHLLPTFDIATIDEDNSTWVGPTFDELAQYPPDSEEQQRLISETRDQNAFNWGYDPFHFTVPEGSYATDPDGPQRIVDFREMVQALNELGLRLVIDVVYNHTNASGQSPRSVLDRIVPGYYHRLNAAGRVERSTCCDNTATEHDMMRKLMIDSVVTWATMYRVDGFRFDLMGHHMKEDMLAVREALDALTLDEHGVDGRAIVVYGEGWNFGEVADNQRGVNATQFNMAGTGIGTFNDRLRDAARGGSPFGGQTEQGFINGLYFDPNDFEQGTAAEQLQRVLHFADLIRLGLAGNLAGYQFVNSEGVFVPGRELRYNDQIAGYTELPRENIVYVSKHDNETLFDIIQYKAPVGTSTADRARIQALGNAMVMLSQGVPFFQAGDDMLRSKSLDRNSYNSGDWFNRLDFTYQENNWGMGLPPAADNQGVWPIMQPLLANPDLKPRPENIMFAVLSFQDMLQIRRSSPLFRLETAEQVQERLAFHNTGPDQIPGLIVMSLSDMVGEALDPQHAAIVVLFNARPERQSFAIADFSGQEFGLHPVLAARSDSSVHGEYDVNSGTFTAPGRSAVVFVLPEGAVLAEEEPVATSEATPVAAAVSTPEPTPAAAPALPTETPQSIPIWILVAGMLAVVLPTLAYFLARRRRTTA
jgi:pullulanase